MEKPDMNIFVGVGSFAIGLLYFYVLSLSVVVTWTGLMSWWFVAAGWVLLFAVLYGERYLNETHGRSFR